jgi:hypothetical protein
MPLPAIFISLTGLVFPAEGSSKGGRPHNHGLHVGLKTTAGIHPLSIFCTHGGRAGHGAFASGKFIQFFPPEPDR